ncbi:MAG: thymidylate kinase [Planctomycetota bacterium]|nr:thymidylate kinase [Planctomycetota bacterium]
MPRPYPGHFFSLEGPDGGGKTTQARLLVEWLRSFCPQVVACHDPGGTDLGDRLRSILLDRSNTAISLRAEMLLYMASRAQLVEEVIRPALQAGAIVVSDRYLLSTLVYQGMAGGLDPEEIWTVGRSATGGLMPDLTVVIDVPLELAQARVGKPRDRIEDRPDTYRQRVREGYLEAIRTLDIPHVLIDGSAEPDIVAGHIRDEVARALGITPRS